jgi:hypothetical protein
MRFRRNDVVPVTHRHHDVFRLTRELAGRVMPTGFQVNRYFARSSPTIC